MREKNDKRRFRFFDIADLLQSNIFIQKTELTRAYRRYYRGIKSSD